MSQAWINEYILLALRIDKVARALNDGPVIDSFYGPPALQSMVAHEPIQSINNLAEAAIALEDALPAQGFHHQRAIYLAKHIRALEVICRRLSGLRLTLEEELSQCLDIQPLWKPEADFEQALSLLNEALPGSRDLRTRYQAWQARITLPPNRADLVLPILHRILAEARHRTQHFVELPAEAALELHPVHDKPYGAANWYLGGFRSRLEINLDRPVNLFGLLYQMCHEGYPGHHTEFALKERSLYQGLGYVEQSMFIIGPQLVIAEGIASLAVDMIFTADEVADWLKVMILEMLGIAVDDVDLPKLVRAISAISLDDLGNNLVMMLRSGYTEAAIVEYALAYTPFAEEHVRKSLQSLQAPLRQIYTCTYFHGKRILQPLLQGDDRRQVFRRLLTEQVYPSLVETWTGASRRE